MSDGPDDEPISHYEGHVGYDRENYDRMIADYYERREQSKIDAKAKARATSLARACYLPADVPPIPLPDFIAYPSQPTEAYPDEESSGPVVQESSTPEPAPRPGDRKAMRLRRRGY